MFSDFKVYDRVRCCAWRMCQLEDCYHWKIHQPSLSVYTLGHSCEIKAAYCSVVGGFVCDEKISFFEEECPCDPNIEFRKRKSNEKEEAP